MASRIAGRQDSESVTVSVIIYSRNIYLSLGAWAQIGYISYSTPWMDSLCPSTPGSWLGKVYSFVLQSPAEQREEGFWPFLA